MLTFQNVPLFGELVIGCAYGGFSQANNRYNIAQNGDSRRNCDPEDLIFNFHCGKMHNIQFTILKFIGTI